MKKGIIALTVSFLAVSAAAQQPVSADRFADAVNHWNKEHGAQTYERYKPDRFREIADNIVAYQNADGGWPKNLDMLARLDPDSVKAALKPRHRLSTLDNLIILCGHYKGIDYRIREHLVTREISIGDYVLTGGELAACIIADSVIRIIPGAIGDEASALTDCFQDNLLAPPVYTRPAEFNGWKVPDVLLSGNFARIDRWKEEQAWERTKRLRPDLLKEE